MSLTCPHCVAQYGKLGENKLSSLIVERVTEIEEKSFYDLLGDTFKKDWSYQIVEEVKSYKCFCPACNNEINCIYDKKNDYFSITDETKMETIL